MKDSIVKQSNRILREKNTISIPALWRNDNGIIVYTSDKDGKTVLDVPYHWGDFEQAKWYEVTNEGLRLLKEVRISKNKVELMLKRDVPYYLIPEF